MNVRKRFPPLEGKPILAFEGESPALSPVDRPKVPAPALRAPTVDDIAKGTGLPKKEVRRALAKLKREGLVAPAPAPAEECQTRRTQLIPPPSLAPDCPIRGSRIVDWCDTHDRLVADCEVAALRAENAAKTTIITELVDVFGGDSQFMEDLYGKKCLDFEEGCPTCRAYAVIERARAAVAAKKGG